MGAVYARTCMCSFSTTYDLTVKVQARSKRCYVNSCNWLAIHCLASLHYQAHNLISFDLVKMTYCILLNKPVTMEYGLRLRRDGGVFLTLHNWSTPSNFIIILKLHKYYNNSNTTVLTFSSSFSLSLKRDVWIRPQNKVQLLATQVFEQWFDFSLR